MARFTLALSAALLMAAAPVAVPAVAQADPRPPCTFNLSPPKVEQVAGSAMVTATLAPYECGPPATPAQSVACVQILAGDSPTMCMQNRGSDTAQVQVPYRPGAAYVSTGRGCGAWMGQWHPAPDCQLLGPIQATL